MTIRVHIRPNSSEKIKIGEVCRRLNYMSEVFK